MKQEQVSRSPRNDLRSPGFTWLIWFARIVVAACLGALAGVMVTGCGFATWSGHAVRTPSGNWGFAMHCTRKIDCYTMASNACPLGYTFVDQDRVDGYESRAFASPQGGSANSHSTHDGYMMVECKQVEGP